MSDTTTTEIYTGYLKSAGIDATASYSFGLDTLGLNDGGKLNFELVGTYLDKHQVQPLPGLGTYDCAGMFGPTCGQPTPRWRHQLRPPRQMPWSNATLSTNWRYFGSAKLSTNTEHAFLQGKAHAIKRKNKPYSDLDIAAKD